MQDFESHFIVSKTSWRIYISFAGNIIEKNSETADLIKINDFLFLKLNIPETNQYIHGNKLLIENGILWIADSIPDKSPKIIEIHTIDFNFMDFQIEGLFFGIAHWLSAYYNIEMPAYNVKYERHKRKYIFWFNEDHKEATNLLYPEGFVDILHKQKDQSSYFKRIISIFST